MGIRTIFPIASLNLFNALLDAGSPALNNCAHQGAI